MRWTTLCASGANTSWNLGQFLPGLGPVIQEMNLLQIAMYQGTLQSKVAIEVKNILLRLIAGYVDEGTKGPRI